MNIMRCFSVVACAVFLVGTAGVARAQSNAANSVQNAAVQTNAQKDFASEITGVLGDPGLATGAAKKPHNGAWGSPKKVKFYMTSWCPYCKKMKQFLDDSKIPYEKIDIEKSVDGKKEYKKLMARGIPVLVIDRTVIRGYDPAAAKAAWDEWNS